MSACPRVVDLSRRRHVTPGEPAVTERVSAVQQLVDATATLTQLQRTSDELQVRVMNAMAASRAGGQIRADFSAFPTPHYAKVSAFPRRTTPR